MSRILVAAVAIVFASPLALFAESPTNPPGTYYTSWLGNTFLDNNSYSFHKNVTELVSDVCLSTSNARVFSSGYAEGGGGATQYNASDGDITVKYDRVETGFGDPTSCVAADNQYVYLGSSAKGVLRTTHAGNWGPYESFLGTINVQGLYLKAGKLYVSDYGNGKIRVVNTSNMTEERNWNCAGPLDLTVDNSGNVWVVTFSNTSESEPDVSPMFWGEKVRSFSSTGTPGPEITDFDKPISVAVDNAGLLLVGGLNAHSQIWKYDVSGTPSKVGTFGAEKGIFSGVSGAFTNSAKLHWIKSIAVDASNNIYTSCCYGTFWGGCVEKWSSSGSLLWRDFAGTSLDCAGIDPYNETEVYGKYHHYSLDYSKTTPGTEWSLKGFTVDRFKYPNDIRVDHHTDVMSRSLGAGVFRIGGKLFVARSHQEGYQCELFRQETSTDGEVLVPSFMMGNGGDSNNHFYNATTKTWISKPKKGDYNQYFCIAKNGDLFTITDNDNYIVQYPFGGLDANGNPDWDASTATLSSVPEFTYDVRRVQYDSDADVMYVTGDEPEGQWGTFLKVRRYNNWSSGNRTSSYTVTLPYGDANYTPETSYGGGMPVAFYAAGDYLFVAYGYGHIRILAKSDGHLVGTLTQNVNGLVGGGGQIDASFGMTAYKRSNGEYIVLFENASWSNIMMHRWCPGNCTATASHPVTATSTTNLGARIQWGKDGWLLLSGLSSGVTTIRISSLSGRTVHQTRCVSHNGTARVDNPGISRGSYVIAVNNRGVEKRSMLSVR